MARIVRWKDREIDMEATYAISCLPLSLTGRRNIKVRFGNIPAGIYHVTVNKRVFRNLDFTKLTFGITVKVSM